MNILLGIILFLSLVAIFLFFRSSEILSVAKKKVSASFEDDTNSTNAIFGVVFLIISFVVIIWYSYDQFDNYFLPMASEHAPEIEVLFWTTTAITFTVFLLTQIVMFYFAYRYRFNKTRKAHFYPENHKLEIVWTVVPAIVLVGLIGWGLVKWNKIMGPPPKDAEVIEVVGYQFAWASRYPGPDNELGNANYKLIDVENIVGIDFSDSSSLDDFMPREIHIPKGRPVLFKIKARDVIHSVYLPYMRSQMNAVPGMPTQMWFVPSKTTAEMREETGNENFNFEIVCNKICGRAHFSMKHTVVVLEEWEYIKWKKSQKSWVEKNPDYYANFVKNNSSEFAVLND